MTATSVERVNGMPKTSPEPRFDPVALAEAEAIRTRAAAEAEALRIEAEGKAEAAQALAAEQAEALRLENEKTNLTLQRNELRFQRERSEQLAKIAKTDKEREETDRAREEANRKDEERQQEEDQSAAAVAEAEEQWRKYALRFYIVCSVVALPVQIAAFYNPHALWLLAAPVMLEGGAWVVLKGARAAATSSRPHWHYRLIAWCLAFIAAGINLWHGLNAFDSATAIGTAFASIAGPGVYDLYEHGQIRKRSGTLTRRERRAKRKTERAEAARLAAEAKQRAAAEEAARKAAEKARTELRETRQREFPEVWKEAVKIGAALGKEPDDSAVWPRAYRNIEGTDPGESITSISSRRAAEKRVEAALTGIPVSTLSKTTNAQRANQMPRAQRGPARKPPKRRAGDTGRYVDAARKQAAIAAKNAAAQSPGGR
jgi:hypothetical protein